MRRRMIDQGIKTYEVDRCSEAWPRQGDESAEDGRDEDESGRAALCRLIQQPLNTETYDDTVLIHNRPCVCVECRLSYY